MTARIIPLPRTAAGRAVLRECIHGPLVCADYRWPDGSPVEGDDFDAMAVEMAELASRPDDPALTERIQRDIDESPYPPPRGWRKRPLPPKRGDR